jgi:glycosyltransferase involved in cell wall biosynthesis
VEDRNQVKIMRKINLLYVLDNPASVHEYRYLKMISSDQDINLHVATCSPVEFIVDIRKLNLKIFKSPEHKIHSSLPVLNGLLHSFRYYRFTGFIKKLIKELEIDLIHSGWLSLSSYAVLKTGFHPVLAMSWGSDVLNNPCNQTPHNSKHLLKKIKYVAQNSDAIYSDANYVADTLVEITGITRNKIHVFPQLGVDMNLYYPDDDKRNITREKLNLNGQIAFLSTRCFLPVYALDQTIKAFKNIRKDYDNVKLILCGEGPLEKQLKTLVSDMNLEDSVIFTGNVYDRELINYYRACDIYISNSLSDGTSSSLLEAMCCGMPIIVSDLPTNMEWIKDGENGFIIERNNIKSIYDKMLYCVRNQDAIKALGIKNINIAQEKIDMNKNYMKLKNIYLSLTCQTHQK